MQAVSTNIILILYQFEYHYVSLFLDTQKAFQTDATPCDLDYHISNYPDINIPFLILEIKFHWLLLAWAITLALGALFCCVRRVLTFKVFVLFFLFDLIYLIGPEPTLLLLGTVIVSWKRNILLAK